MCQILRMVRPTVEIVINSTRVMGVRVTVSCRYCIGFEVMHLLPAGLPRSGKLPVLFLLTGQKSGFSPRRDDSLHRFRSHFAVPRGTWVRLTVQNITSIGADWWECGPQNIKHFNFLVKTQFSELGQHEKSRRGIWRRVLTYDRVPKAVVQGIRRGRGKCRYCLT